MTVPTSLASSPRTLFEKIWDAHLVKPPTSDTPAILYVDLHLIHEVTSPQAFTTLRERGLSVRRPDRTVATMDHSTPTAPRGADGKFRIVDDQAAAQIAQLETNCRDFGIELFALGSEGQGIVHVIGPELGLTQPGSTIVCGDSHTSTHGAFGALAFGIGTSEVGHVLATQCLLQQRPRTLAITIEGQLGPGVTAKDIILAVIARIGIGGGTGHVIEYRGSAIRGLSMEERMTVCNMSIEAGARAGLCAPDDATYQYLAGRPRAPAGADWDQALARWRKLPGDEGATFDREERFDAAALEPMITYGTNPGMGIGITAPVPSPTTPSMEKALRYMGLQPDRPLLGHPIDVVFIGSCTNSRLSDLRAAAGLLRGRRVAPGVRALVVPGSQRIKKAAEAEGLNRIFKEAGAEWREAGCSMCIAMNGDQLAPGQYAVSTSNRNFEGRQGAGGRTFLASPLTAAAAAVTGKITDARTLTRRNLNPDGTDQMEPIVTFSSKTVALPIENVDTDQIIPARFLKVTTKVGIGKHLFADWRYDGAGQPRPDFILNRPEAAGATVLVAGDNFGCGSSREHAPWALHDHGFRAVVSTSIADIFRNNALKNGLLPIVVDPAAHARLLATPGAQVTISLESQSLTLPDGTRVSFSIDPFARYCLMNGVDELGFLLSADPAISAFESGRAWRSACLTGAVRSRS